MQEGSYTNLPSMKPCLKSAHPLIEASALLDRSSHSYMKSTNAAVWSPWLVFTGKLWYPRRQRQVEPITIHMHMVCASGQVHYATNPVPPWPVALSPAPPIMPHAKVKIFDGLHFIGYCIQWATTNSLQFTTAIKTICLHLLRHLYLCTGAG